MIIRHAVLCYTTTMSYISLGVKVASMSLVYSPLVSSAASRVPVSASSPAHCCRGSQQRRVLHAASRTSGGVPAVQASRASWTPHRQRPLGLCPGGLSVLRSCTGAASRPVASRCGIITSNFAVKGDAAKNRGAPYLERWASLLPFSGGNKL